jgi:hypothetical protein
MAQPTLSDYLDGLLDSADSWVTTSRSFVSHGRPVAACDELAVWCERIDAGQTPKGPCQLQPSITLHVTLFRCVPTMAEDGNELPAAVYDASAHELADDGWAIWLGILHGYHNGGLFGDTITCECEALDLTGGVVALEPQGGMGGWDATLRDTVTTEGAHTNEHD